MLIDFRRIIPLLSVHSKNYICSSWYLKDKICDFLSEKVTCGDFATGMWGICHIVRFEVIVNVMR